MYSVWSCVFVTTLPIFVFSIFSIATPLLMANATAVVARASTLTRARLRMSRMVYLLDLAARERYVPGPSSVCGRARDTRARLARRRRRTGRAGVRLRERQPPGASTAAAVTDPGR